MTRELMDLRASILEKRYTDALAIVDELEGMSRQAILRNIQSFLLRMLVHLIKNQVEQRLAKSWANSIRGSLRNIKKLNLQDNKTAYYVKEDEWDSMLEEEFEEAVAIASEEVFEGVYSQFELSELVDKILIVAISQSLLDLTYRYSVKDLPRIIDQYLAELPGGEEWKFGTRGKD